MKYQDSGRLVAGDHVYIFVSDRYPRLLDKLFASRAEVDPEDADFFGAFAVDPSRPATDLEAAYGPTLSEAERQLSIGALIASRLGGRAEYADRVLLNPIELIVRDVDEKGKVLAVGVSFEPSSTQPRSIPIFLSLAEMFGWFRSLFGRAGRRGGASPSDDVASVPKAKAEG